MAFFVGQKVVCVDASDTKMLKQGAIYTIRAIRDQYLEFHEPETWSTMGFGDGWYKSRFRPIVEKKTDISLLEEIARRASQTGLVDA